MTYYAIVQNNEIVYVGHYLSITMKRALEIIYDNADFLTLREESTDNSFVMRADKVDGTEFVLNICELSPTRFIDML